MSIYASTKQNRATPLFSSLTSCSLERLLVRAFFLTRAENCLQNIPQAILNRGFALNLAELGCFLHRRARDAPTREETCDYSLCNWGQSPQALCFEGQELCFEGLVDIGAVCSFGGVEPLLSGGVGWGGGVFWPGNRTRGTFFSFHANVLMKQKDGAMRHRRGARTQSPSSKRSSSLSTQISLLYVVSVWSDLVCNFVRIGRMTAEATERSYSAGHLYR